ncbi:MAG: ABC transporter ATP-binding protein/permease [Lachnospiraceae bacterium]|nr:ABC transporter ATP-binding protein/permease [Ruminococcus sp.]MCM1275825.1 ABC transporter ATP-binding protein/permease [Lachnospiraceae bacterium]
MSDNAKKRGVVGKTLRYFFPVAWKFDKAYFILSAINVLLGAAVPFPEIMLMPRLLDSLISPERDLKTIITYAAVMIALNVGISLLNSALSIHLEKYSDKFYNFVAEEISQRCMEIDFALTENKDALDQISRGRQGLDYSNGVHGISFAFFTILTNVLKIFGVVAVLAVSAPWMLLIIAALLTVSAVINSRKNRIEIKYFSDLSKVERVWSYVLWELENFRFGKDIRIYGAADTLVKKSTEQTDRIMAFNTEWAEKKYPLDILGVIVTAVRDFGTYLYLGALAIFGRITIGTFSQLVTAGGTLNSSVEGAIFGYQDIVKRCNYAYEVVKLMEYPPMLQKGSRRVENLNAPHEIEFRNVGFSYPNTGVRVLDNVSITIKAGERLSVVGLNGAGKTTFIKLLCRLYDVDEGEILIDGVNIREYDYDEYMKLFSVVFQDFRLLSFSAKDNVLLGAEDEDGDGAVDAMLEKVGLLDKISSLPKGRDTMMFREFDREGVQLSGGEQQKLAIARALYKDAPVVILDEPTAALDPVAEYEIYCRFNELVGGKTAVYISHRLSSCKFCDRIAVFGGGTIKELGTHDELVNREGGIYSEMFRAQAQYYV